MVNWETRRRQSGTPFRLKAGSEQRNRRFSPQSVFEKRWESVGMGRNTDGQLGDETTTDRSTPLHRKWWSEQRNRVIPTVCI